MLQIPLKKRLLNLLILLAFIEMSYGGVRITEIFKHFLKSLNNIESDNPDKIVASFSIKFKGMFDMSVDIREQLYSIARSEIQEAKKSLSERNKASPVTSKQIIKAFIYQRSSVHKEDFRTTFFALQAFCKENKVNLCDDNAAFNLVNQYRDFKIGGVPFEFC